jgi:hypothetical protein
LLTTTQAENIADELLSQQRRAATEAKNAAAPRVPFAYYVRGLNTLEPWERPKLVRLAVRTIHNDWKLTSYLFCLVGLCWLVLWQAGLFGQGGVSPMLFGVLCPVVVFLPLAYFTRREIRRRLLDVTAAAELDR